MGTQTDIDGFAFHRVPILCLLWFFTFLIYTSVTRLYFHPLAKYPGPRLWAISKLPDAYHRITGCQCYVVAELHRQYGPIVRIAPDELSYNVEEAWQDIYGKPPQRNTQLRKDPLQFIPPSSSVNGMIQEPDDEKHQRMRRYFTHGFSEKALRDQEPIMKRYFDLLIQRLHENCGKVVDMNNWYNLTTFDIIGDLAFGESFEGLKNSGVHYWVKTIQMMMKVAPIIGLTQKFYPLDKVILFLASRLARKAEIKHISFVKAKVQKRLALEAPRQDFMIHAQRTYNTPDGLTLQEICEQAAILIVAGSETTASLLSAVTYLLLTNQPVLAKLTTIVRTAFQSEAEINSITVNNLDYLLAVLNEALRMYPPVVGIARVTPPDGCIIAGNLVPGNTCVSVNQWGASRSPSNFLRPDEFIPERWIGAAKFKNDKRKVVQPFSVGPRNCLGKSLAYVEMKIILARVIWNFDLELCEESLGWLEGQRFYVVAERPELMVRLKPVVRD